MSKNFNVDLSNSGLIEAGEPLVDAKGLEPWSFNGIVNKGVRIMLIRIFECNPELEDKITEAYNKFTGGDFKRYSQSYAKVEDHRIPPTFFMHGPPGHGKSSVPKTIAKTVCDLLGLNLVTKFEEGFVPSENDFVLPIVEMSNETSNLMVGGIPIVGEYTHYKLDEDGTVREEVIQQMERALFQTFSIAKQANYGLVVLDDVSNLPRKLQNIILSLLEESRFQSTNFGKDKMFFSTGNLGAADGSIAQRISGAAANRVFNCYLESDAVLETRPYLNTQHISEDLDVGVTAYTAFTQDVLKLNPFEPSSKNASHLCPRTVDRICSKMPNLYYEFDHLNKDSSEEEINEFISILRSEIASISGFNQSAPMANYIADLVVNHMPVARDVIYSKTPKKRLEAINSVKEAMGALKGVDKVDFEMKFSEALLSKYFTHILREKSMSGMDKKDREIYHHAISTIFEGMSKAGREFAEERVRTTVPAIMKDIGVPKDQTALIENTVNHFADVVQARLEDPAAKNNKENNVNLES